jgi:hypothetical protein
VVVLALAPAVFPAARGGAGISLLHVIAAIAQAINNAAEPSQRCSERSSMLRTPTESLIWAFSSFKMARTLDRLWRPVRE